METNTKSAGRLHRPLQRAWRGAGTQAPLGGVRSPAAQAGQQGAVLSAASALGHSPWPQTPGLSLPGSRPTASLAAPEMPTPPGQCTPAPRPSPRGGGEIASTPRSEAQKGTRVLRSSAARTAIHQGPVAAARLYTEQLVFRTASSSAGPSGLQQWGEPCLLSTSLRSADPAER